MTAKVINLCKDEWKEALDKVYNELKDGTRKNTIIVSEMPNGDEEDEEGSLFVQVLNINFCRHVVGMLSEASMLACFEYWEED